MSEFRDLEVDKSWLIVRKKVKEKYNDYCLKKGNVYPPIPFNSTPEPYQHLIESFKEEISALLGKSESEIEAMVPSSSLFAEMYRTGKMPTGKKLHACYLYATGKSKLAFDQENRANELNQLETEVIPKSTISRRAKTRLLITSYIVVLIGITIYLATTQNSFTALPAGLIIGKPINGETVPREVFVEGKVENASTVWLVVRARGIRRWVSAPINVHEDGTWRGPIYIGSTDEGDIGVKYQIQAFVNPIKSLRTGEILHSWPEAQLSSKPIDVTRGPRNMEHPSGLALNWPTNGIVVPRESLAKGKVENASKVWLVIRDTKLPEYWVQSPISVANDGTWEGLILVEGNGPSFIGLRSQIRAFVNPTKPLKAGEMLDSWPEAELSSKAIEVIRGPEVE